MKTALYLVVLILCGYPSNARYYRNFDMEAGGLFAGITQHYSLPSESSLPVAGTPNAKANTIVTEPQKPKNLALTTNLEANILTIVLPDGAQFISIWNLNGKLMYEQKLSSDRLQINVEAWHSGDYVMHCAHGLSTISRTFTVRH